MARVLQGIFERVSVPIFQGWERQIVSTFMECLGKNLEYQISVYSHSFQIEVAVIGKVLKKYILKRQLWGLGF